MSAEAKAARAKQIMDAAADMLLSIDYRHLKMSSIAKAVGISNGLIFKYFKTKETLFLSLLWREYEKRLDYLEAEAILRREHKLELDYLEKNGDLILW